MKNEEHKEQVALCNWLKIKKINYAAIPNGFWMPNPFPKGTLQFNKQKKANAMFVNNLKAEGMKIGFPDLMIFVNGKVIFIEMKKKKGGRTSDEQKTWISDLQLQGHNAKVCNGFIEAQKFIEEVA